MMTEINTNMRNLKASNRQLRIFGIQLFFVFTIITGLMFLKGKPYWITLAVIGLFFLFIGLLIPSFLKGFYRVWMALGFVLSQIITWVILTITFFVVFTPIGLWLKILKKDFLDRKIENTKKTYWRKHKPVADKLRYLKQF